LVSKADKIASKCFHNELELNSNDVQFIQSFVFAQDAVAKSDPSCQDIVNKYCGNELKNLQDLLLQGATPKDIIKGSRNLIKCLIDHEDQIGDACDDMRAVVFVGKKDEESKCHKELYKKCGTPLNKLKDAIEEVSIINIITSAFETASCLTENISDITKACTSSNNINVESSSPLAKFNQASTYGLRNGDEGRCHKELYDVCGNEIASLKKAIKDTSPNGIVGSSLEVAGCITTNFVKLVKACSPFEKSKILASSQNNMDDNVHFDFYDCVEMAKRQIHHQQNEDSFYHGSYEHSQNGFILVFVLFALLSTFLKGYLFGKGISFCQSRFNVSKEEATKETVADGYSKLKEPIA